MAITNWKNLPSTETPINAENLNNDFGELETNIHTILQRAYIEESGNNENGYYIKFSDGNMICYNVLTMNNKNTTYHYQSVVWTYPQEFIEVPIVNTTSSNWNTYCLITKNNPTKTNCSVMTHTISTSNSTFQDPTDFAKANAIAIGRWK